MSSNKSLSIRQLEKTDAAAVAEFMRLQSPEYLRFFYAFGADETAIAEMLSSVERDVYAGVFWQTDLIGVFMLRGWDAGYELLSIGVMVDEKYRGKGVLNLMIESMKLIGRLSGIERFMAKSHPDNAGLKNLLQMGFRRVGVEESTGNIIWHLETGI